MPVSIRRQANGGDSALVHSIYMQIQVPFFTTFRHYHPDDKLLFFSNLDQFPDYLERLFKELRIETVTLPYLCIPPKGWYGAWRNQFYLYDILRYMEKRMQADDTLLICDADCLCMRPLEQLFSDTRKYGSALYDASDRPDLSVNGITLKEMTDIYNDCYVEKEKREKREGGNEENRSGKGRSRAARYEKRSHKNRACPLLRGEFISLRGDVVARINEAYPALWNYNLERFAANQPKLNEEAHFLSVVATRLNIHNNIANQYVKRLWTYPKYNTVEKGDEQLAVWHLPYEKKRGLYLLYKHFVNHPTFDDEEAFRKKASAYTGVPTVTFGETHPRFHHHSFSKNKRQMHILILPMYYPEKDSSRTGDICSSSRLCNWLNQAAGQDLPSRSKGL